METIRQGIISDDEVRALIGRIGSMPDRLEKARETLAGAEIRLAMLDEVVKTQEVVDQYEAEAAFEVANETIEENGKTKKKYGNETQRKTAAQLLLNANKDYIDAVDALARAKQTERGLKNEVGKCNMTVRRATDEMYAYKSQAELVAGLSHEDSTKERIDRIVAMRGLLDDASAVIAGLGDAVEEMKHD